jgi:hypothetical protein
MAGFIDAAVQDIDNRLKELKYEEERLRAARTALVGEAPARRGPGRPAASEPGPKPATTRRRRSPGRPRGRRGGNTRSSQALELVRSRPGITIPEIASAMKIEPNYLYRVMPKLTSDGLITREGQGWHPARQAVTPAPAPSPFTPPPAPAA